MPVRHVSSRRVRPVSALVVLALAAAACGGGQPSVVASLAPSTAESASPTVGPMAPTVAFAFVSDQPTVSREMTGIEEAYINPGAVIEQDGTLHMFANVFTGWPGRVQVPHLTSTDGREWSLASAGPVMTSDDVPFGTTGADVSTGYVTDDGTWVLVFETVSSVEPWKLGRATAPGPDGPWTIDPEPILVARSGREPGCGRPGVAIGGPDR